MARCSCNTKCSCLFEVNNTSSLSLVLAGSGTSLAPYELSGTVTFPPTPAQIDVAPFSRTDVLTVGTGVARWRFPFAATILGVTAAVNTAPVGASIILDVNRNGTTIFTTQANRPTIAAGATATAAEAVPDVTAISAGDYLTIDRDQVGSSTPGSDLMVFVRYSH